jgi:hypothetical protein
MYIYPHMRKWKIKGRPNVTINKIRPQGESHVGRVVEVLVTTQATPDAPSHGKFRKPHPHHHNLTCTSAPSTPRTTPPRPQTHTPKLQHGGPQSWQYAQAPNSARNVQSLTRPRSDPPGSRDHQMEQYVWEPHSKPHAHGDRM